MFRNYFKTAIRNLWKSKGFSAINIIGLAIGLSTCLLIILYVFDELSFDKFNTKAKRIYVVTNEIRFGGNFFKFAATPGVLGSTLVRELPNVEQFVKLRWHGSFLIKKGNSNLRESRICFADSTLFDVFTFPMISGNPKTALTLPHSLVITESMARKYFNRVDVAGQTLVIDDTLNYKVTGVIKDIPEASHFHFDFFVPMLEDERSRDESGWLSENYNTYLLVREGTDTKKLVRQIDEITYQHIGPILQSVLHTGLDEFKSSGNYVKNGLVPLLDIHLHPERTGELFESGSIYYVYIFSAIALFILLIACVNFMNLSTARSANRAREVGIRKVLGSLRKNLISQFLVESLIFGFIALILALICTFLLMHWFNQLSGKHLTIGLVFQPVMLTTIIALIIVVGFLAGSYPAFFLSAFQPIEVLKGKLAKGFKTSWLRNTLVIFQFVVSITLIISTIIIYNQLTYIRSKDLGFNRNGILIIPNTGFLDAKSESFKDDIQKISGVESVTMTGFLPVGYYRGSDAFFMSPTLEQKTALSSQAWVVDDKYLSTFNMQIVSGRNFNKELATDSSSVIINEAAANYIGVKEILNKKLYRIDDIATRKLKVYTIVGVVKNFNFSSLRERVTPVVLGYGKETGSVAIRLKNSDASGIINQVKAVWENFLPGQPFSYSFMDDDFNKIYSTEQQTGKIFITFAIIAILVACLGLFGLATYAAEQRRKEIGIRKVLGASTGNITQMLSREFIKLVSISALVAFPIAWYAMHKWLEEFAYRVNISWYVFLISALIALSIALFTVSYQAIKAAIANPVKALRSE